MRNAVDKLRPERFGRASGRRRPHYDVEALLFEAISTMSKTDPSGQ
jgi:hypothetical protein